MVRFIAAACGPSHFRLLWTAWLINVYYSAELDRLVWVRGIGSIYYLAYALSHGLAPELSTSLVGLTLTAVAVSVLVHGVSVTPLMRLYEKKRSRLFSANITDY